MPRPARRAPAPRDVTTTPTRTTTTNAITAAIPPFMLETPPHAPFVTTPLPPSNNPGNSIVPEGNVQRGRNARGQQQTPTADGNTQNHANEPSQTSTQALGSTASEAGNPEDNSLLESIPHDAEDTRLLIGLRDISSLATWTLSSAKPGCALSQLRHPSPAHFWQSDGPQPHTLTLHFFKLVAIVKMRIYLDFELDESYTPTKMRFFAGMSEGGLVEFGGWQVEETIDTVTGEPHSNIDGVRGWIDVQLKGVGGRDSRHHEGSQSPNTTLTSRKKPAKPSDGAAAFPISWGRDGKTSKDEDENTANENLNTPDVVGGDVLKAMVVQVRICENHQNGKDTHVRGFQVFASDDVGGKAMRKTIKQRKVKEVSGEEDEEDSEVVGLQPADWMGDPEIR